MILAAVFAGVILPIVPVLILWINMTTAVLLGSMLGFEPKEPESCSDFCATQKRRSWIAP